MSTKTEISTDDVLRERSPRRLGQLVPNGMLEDNYPRNMWWAAAHVDEVKDGPLARWILETPVVIYRLENGTPAALYD